MRFVAAVKEPFHITDLGQPTHAFIFSVFVLMQQAITAVLVRFIHSLTFAFPILLKCLATKNL